MKKALTLLITVAMVLSTLAGCDGSQAGTAFAFPDEIAETPQENARHLNVSTFWITPDLNPSNGYNGWVLTRIGVGETLLRLDDNVELVPCVADSWEMIDENTWSFHIRKGLTFHNGKAVDAEAVRAAFQNAFAYNERANHYVDLKEMKADGQTLTIATNRPNAALAFNLVEPLFSVIDVTEESYKEMPAGTGPYKITGFDADVRVELTANENYWDGNVGLDTITVSEIADSEARVLALQSGETEMTVTLDNSSLTLFDSADYNVSIVIGLRTNVVFMNNERPFLKDITLRRALCYAIDRESYAATITGGEAATGLFPSSLPYNNEALTAYEYDRERALQILEHAGYTDSDGDGVREMDGQNIILEYYQSAAHGSGDAALLAQAIQADLIRIGIKVEIIMAENLSDIAAAGTFDLCSDNSNTAPTGDAQYFLSNSYSSTSASNTGRYRNTEFDALLSEFNTAFAVEDRYKLAHRASQIILDDAANLFVTYLGMNTVSKSYVRNAEQPTVDYYMITKDLTIEK